MVAQKRESSVLARTEVPVKSNIIDFAYLVQSDYLQARALGLSLSDWACYEDFCTERDAQFIGFSTSGLLAYQTQVSLNCFHDWTIHAQSSMSLQSLDVFAGLVRNIRSNPDRPVEPMLTEQLIKHSDGDAPNRGGLSIPISRDRYQQWLTALEAICLPPSCGTIQRYARLLVEYWAEPPILTSLEAD